MDDVAIPAPLPDPSPEIGYSRAMVDDFVAAAAEERDRLLALIADADARADEARVAVGAHEVMVTMLVDAHHELAARTREAERTAREILEAADREARAIVRDAHGEAASDGDLVTTDGTADETDQPVPALQPALDEDAIDLTMLEELADPPMVLSPAGSTNGNGQHHGTAGPDRYFDFLRGALVDDEPLGPRPD